MMKKVQYSLMYLPAVVLMTIIFLFSSQPAEESSAESSRVVNLVLHGIEHIRGSAFSSEEFADLAEKIHTPIRKLAHMTEYAILAWTIFIPTLFWNKEKLWKIEEKEKSFIRQNFLLLHINKKVLGKIFLGSILIVMLYAGTDEFHQMFVEGRSGKVTDVLIDTCGAVVGILGFLLLWRIGNWICNKKKGS